MSEFEADHEERDSRYTTVAVVLAVVFLTILGAGVGLWLGLGRGKDGGSNVADRSPAPSVAPSASDDRPATGEPYSGGTNTRTRSASPYPNKSYPPTRRDACPKQSVEAAGTELTLVLYIRTTRSEVWICQGQGRTFYQGHVLGGPFPAATSGTTIFLTDVRYEAGVHAATNGDTVYFVSQERLRIEKNGKETANEPVVDSYGGG
jgi:hypothetical protein